MPTPKNDAPSRFVYSVLFFAPPLRSQPHQKFFLFSSLAAIYEVFSVDDVGCGLRHLYNLQVPDGAAYAGKRCIIKREVLHSKPHRGA